MGPAMMSWPLDILCSVAGVSWGLYFTAYNQSKQRWQRLGGDDNLSPVQHLLAAAEGGAFVSRTPSILDVQQVVSNRWSVLEWKYVSAFVCSYIFEELCDELGCIFL